MKPCVYIQLRTKPSDMKKGIFIAAMILVSSLFGQNTAGEVFRVVAFKKNDNSIQSLSNQVKVKPKLHIYIPDAFSPDGDGINDLFSAVSDNVDVFTMRIYNRWGELIYTSSDITETWDGKFRGEKANQDAYVYLIEAKRLGDINSSVFKGTVSLIL